MRDIDPLFCHINHLQCLPLSVVAVNSVSGLTVRGARSWEAWSKLMFWLSHPMSGSWPILHHPSAVSTCTSVPNPQPTIHNRLPHSVFTDNEWPFCFTPFYYSRFILRPPWRRTHLWNMYLLGWLANCLPSKVGVLVGLSKELKITVIIRRESQWWSMHSTFCSLYHI